MKRSMLREITFQIIFQYVYMNNLFESKDLYLMEKNINLSEKDNSYVDEVISNIESNINDIDSLISDTLNKEWTIDRLSKVDLSILRLAITEIVYLKIPYKVSVDEALEISKKYSDEKSPRFINAVLSDFLKAVDISEA